MNTLASVPPKNQRETETLMPCVSNAKDTAPAEEVLHEDDGAARAGNTNRRTRFSFQSVTKTALRRAERRGFRSAIIGRACAILAIGGAYFAILHFPSNLYALVMAAGTALVGSLSLTTVGTRYERSARFAVFAGDTIVVTALLAFFPLSSGAEVPQNLVFLTARVQYYYILIAAAILTLSPALVLWTGAWAVGGLLFATGWVLQGMETVVSFHGLGIVRSRDDFLLTFLDPNFLSLSLRFREAVIIATVAVIAGWGVYRARRAIEAHARVDAERRYVESLFAQYLPRSVMSDLIKDGHLQPQTRQATVLFIDIEGFTYIAETMSPDRLLKLLNALFSAITTVIDRSGGVVASYIGDAVLASYNAPLQAREPALQAIQAAERIIALVSQRQFEGVSVHVRIGIATGRVVAGTVGSGSRQTYTLYGDTVNLAQRLEVLNKEYGTRCLACGTTARLARSGRTKLQPVGLVPIRNREQPIEVFKLCGLRQFD